ncbi:MAG: peptidoglycan DD-metalloendopeptidase family protein [Paludibacteraceae bacterium]|nr:peptidoglycan DD-metalloendopeptidase family protein [Paludibacteraceae bacterium]
MMKRNINIVIISIFAMLSSMTTHAQETEKIETDGKMIAGAVSFDDQKNLIDSLMVDEYEDDEDGYTPSDSLYGTWDNANLNPYRVSIDSICDSFTVKFTEYVHPDENVVTSEYGPRWGHFHAGIDIRLNTGDSVKCAFNGKVRIARANKAYRRKGYGYYVVVRHENGLETLYGHMSKVLVKPDQIVRAGDVLGLGGSTGRSTGPHLHFETRFMGNAINPREMIDFENYVILDDCYVITRKESFKELRDYINCPARFYTIKKGDTLGKIARRHHTTVSRLCKLNKIKSTTTLRLGKRIRVS